MTKHVPPAPIRLNLGCGCRPLPGYLNVDMDDPEELKRRYPGEKLPADLPIFHYDIFYLPFADASVAEVRADSLVEHLTFLEEPRFFYEVQRVLEPGGLFRFSTPDFEDAVRLFLAAKDDWKDFYCNDPEAIAARHWFGTYSYATDNRWGYLTAMIFGGQNGAGQFHKNAYTIPKVRALLKRLDMEELDISHFRWKGDRDLMIQALARKRPKVG